MGESSSYRRLRRFVGVARSEAFYALSDEDQHKVNQLNSELRRFGFGPFAVYLYDESCMGEPILIYRADALRQAEGVAHIVRSILTIRSKSYLSKEDQQRISELYQQARAYDLSVVELNDILKMPELTCLVPRTTRVAVRNGRKQLAYQA